MRTTPRVGLLSVSIPFGVAFLVQMAEDLELFHLNQATAVRFSFFLQSRPAGGRGRKALLSHATPRDIPSQPSSLIAWMSINSGCNMSVPLFPTGGHTVNCELVLDPCQATVHIILCRLLIQQCTVLTVPYKEHLGEFYSLKTSSG